MHSCLMDQSTNYNTAGCGYAKTVKCTTAHLCAKGFSTHKLPNHIVLKAIIRHLWWEAYTVCLYTCINNMLLLSVDIAMYTTHKCHEIECMNSGYQGLSFLLSALPGIKAM